MTTFVEPLVLHTTRPCLHCGLTSVLSLDPTSFVAWRRGALVQEAFPTMPPPVREQLITGTHPACWDAMFVDEEDDM